VKYIYFKNSRRQKLCGIISRAESGAAKSTHSSKESDSSKLAVSSKRANTAILMCHGLGSSKDDNLYISLQDKLNELGLATFRMDLLGHGDSDGEYNDLTLTETIDDILCAKHELEKIGYTNIGFIGSSFGGVGGIMAASKEQFHFLVLISPPTYYDVSEMIKSGIYILKELMKINKTTQKKKASPNIRFFRDYGSYDSYAAAEKISIPVLIIQGDKDKIVPLVKSRELKKKIKGSKIKIFKGADHVYTKAYKKLAKEIMKFVNVQDLD